MNMIFMYLSVDNVPLRNGPIFQNFGGKAIVHIFSIVKNDQKCPNKMVVCNGGIFWNFIQFLKVASLI